MSEVNNIQNLNSHYSTNTKVEKPERVVVTGPNSLPTVHLFNDKDAKKRLKAINQDIYVDYKKEKGPVEIDFGELRVGDCVIMSMYDSEKDKLQSGNASVEQIQLATQRLG